jgi:hypothetical protein
MSPQLHPEICYSWHFYVNSSKLCGFDAYTYVRSIKSKEDNQGHAEYVNEENVW